MRKKRMLTIFGIVYLLTAGVLLKSYTEAAVSKTSLAAMCLESSLPCLEVVAVDSEAGIDVKAKGAEVQKPAEQEAVSKQKTKAKGDPLVLIYHTHATESYLPASSGNYHTTKTANTVREVGEVLAETLEAKGISVIHDQTIHDHPSYNASYDRSYETVEALLAKYPSIELIIDLHRDAVAGKPEGPTETVDGKTCASYFYVLGTSADNAHSNKAFLQKLNQVAEQKYDGYTGNILERPYRYNQQLCEKGMLIEMGNNRNHISEVRRCAETFGQILADTL